MIKDTQKAAEAKEKLLRLLTSMQKIDEDLSQGFTLNGERKALVLEKDALTQKIPPAYHGLVQSYKDRGLGNLDAELSASADYTLLKDQLNADYLQRQPENKRIYAWLDYVTNNVIKKLEARTIDFENKPSSEFSTLKDEEKYLDKEKKYKFLRVLLELKDMDDLGKKSTISKIVRGYLTEFIRQTEQQITVCNIENGRNPEAKKYWDSQPHEEFWEAKAPAFFHTAVVYEKFKSLMGTKVDRKAAWEATGEIVRICVDEFKAEYPKLNPDLTPVASVYNEHMHIIEAAYNLNRLFGEKKGAHGLSLPK